MQKDKKTQEPDQEEGQNPLLEHAKTNVQTDQENPEENTKEKIGKVRGYVRDKVRRVVNANERRKSIRQIKKGEKGERGIGFSSTSGLLTSEETKEIYGDSIEMFRIFAEVASKKTRWALQALIDTKEAYGKNTEMLRIFADILLYEDESESKTAEIKIKSLAKAKQLYGDDIYKLEEVVGMIHRAKHKAKMLCTEQVLAICGEDIAKFRVFAEIAEKSYWAYEIESLADIKEAYGDDLEKMKVFQELYLDNKGYIAGLIAKDKELCDEDVEILRILADIGKTKSSYEIKTEEIIEEIIKLRPLYSKKPEMLKALKEVADTPNALRILKIVQKEKEVYGDKPEMLKTFIKLLKECPSDALTILLTGEDEYEQSRNQRIWGRRDYSEESKAIEVARKMGMLINGKKAYEDDHEILEILGGRAIGEHPVSGDFKDLLEKQVANQNSPEILKRLLAVKDRGGYLEFKKLSELKGSYGNDPEKLKIFEECMRESGGYFKAEALALLNKLYGDDVEKLKEVRDKLFSIGNRDDVGIIGRAAGIIGNDFEIFQIFIEAAEKKGVQLFTDLAEFFADDKEKLRELVEITANTDSINEWTKRGILKGKELFKKDLRVLRIFIRVANQTKQNGYPTTKLDKLAEVGELFGGKVEMMEEIEAVMTNDSQNWILDVIIRNQEAYGDNLEMLKVFTGLAKETDDWQILDRLGGARKSYKGNLEMLKVISEVLLVNKKGGAIFAAVVGAKPIYGDDLEMLKTFVKIAEDESPKDQEEYKEESEIFHVLLKASTVVGGPIAYLDQVKNMQALGEAMRICEGNNELMKLFGEMYEESRGKEFDDRPLIEAKEKYGKNIVEIGRVMLNQRPRPEIIEDLISLGIDSEIAKTIAEVSDEISPQIAISLLNAQPVYKDNEEAFAIFADLAKSPLEGQDKKQRAVIIDAVTKAAEVCMKQQNGIGRLRKFAELGKTEEKNANKIEALIVDIVSSIYQDDEERFEILYRLAEENKIYEIGMVASVNGIYGDDNEMFKAIVVEAERLDKKDFDRLIRLKDTYEKDIKVFKKFASHIGEVSETLDEETFTEIIKLKSSYKGDPELFRKFADHINGYLVLTKMLDADTLKKYIEILESNGEEAAKEYIETLPKKAKGMVTSEIPEKHRQLAEYQYLVRYVFPDGNYSNYEENSECGDQMEHVEGYKFNREGYPVVLTGLKGYIVKEGAVPNDELITEYTQRLGNIRQFVSSRGPDNKALQEAFEQKIDKVFDAKAWEEFKGLEDLTIEEKMLCLFLGEAIRRSEKGSESQADSEICDLIIEYKYAFHEDLEAYIHRSADTVKSQKDKPSQNYMLLSELSTIYGENVKHHLRHNILEKFEESKNRDQIIAIFSNKIGQEAESADLKNKQWERINNTFNNPHIPEEGMTIVVKDKKTGEDIEKYKQGKKEVLKKQLEDIFASNIKFETKDEEEEFKKKISEIMAPLEKEFTVETLRSILPELFKLRNLYRSGINEKLQELFTQDINKIFEEIAKYEEDIEQEAKETAIGGEKHKQVKKSKKKRNIRGFFTKNAEAANARMGAYLCIAGDQSMWKNKNYFELVLVDEESNKCVGTVMLLNIEAEDGKKYLWFGPNPFESFLDVVSSEACYNFMHQTICEFASENGFDGVVVPSKDEQILGQCTNRGGDFPGFIKESRLKDKKGNLKIVKFGKNHRLGLSYGYSEGALVWER